MGELLLPVEDGLRIVCAEAAPLGTQEIDLGSALGRVLAEHVVSPSDLPACDRSAMDGFAVRSSDLERVPAELGALAGVGKVRVLTYRLPSARVLSTGDEVVDPASSLLRHQVRNSNGPTLLGALREAGLEPRGLGIARDDPGELDAKLAEG